MNPRLVRKMQRTRSILHDYLVANAAALESATDPRSLADRFGRILQMASLETLLGEKAKVRIRRCRDRCENGCCDITVQVGIVTGVLEGVTVNFATKINEG